MLKKISHFISLFLVLVLLFAARNFLGTHPLLSCLCFLFFSCLYLVTTIQSKENLFIYPVLFFGTLSYYLFLHLIHIPIDTFPAFSLVFVFSLLIAARILEKNDKVYYTIPIYRGMLFTSIIFSGWVLWRPNFYYTSLAIVPFITYLGYAVFYYLRNIFSTKSRHRYAALLYFSAAYLALLYLIQIIDLNYYGVLLLGLVGLFVYSGTVFHKSKGIEYSFSFYIIGFIVLIVAFLYISRVPILIPLYLFFTSLIYWAGLHGMQDVTSVRKPSNISEKVMPKIFLVLINIGGLGVLVQFSIQKFPLTMVNMIVALLLSLLFFKIAFERKLTLLKFRNHYIYYAGALFTTFFYLLLFYINPFGNRLLNLLLTTGLLIGCLVFGRFLEKREELLLYDSVFDLSYLIVASAFILSFIGGEYSPATAAILTAVFLVVYLIFMNLRKRIDLLYGVVLIANYGYYTLLTAFGLQRELVGILFLSIGLGLMIVTYLNYRKQSTLKNILYFSWILFSVISIFLSYPFPTTNMVCFSICAISFLLMGQALIYNYKRRLVT